jgi:hypothetical protein
MPGAENFVSSVPLLHEVGARLLCVGQERVVDFNSGELQLIRGLGPGDDVLVVA